MAPVFDHESKPLLAVETSGLAVGAALWNGTGLIGARTAKGGARHGTALGPLAADILKEHALAPRDLDAIGVSLGPGSWTGLRIGLAWGKAVAWGSGIGLVGVPSLEALAMAVCAARDGGGNAGAAGSGAEPVLAVRDAFSEGLYAALFEETFGGLRRLMEEGVFGAADLPAAVARALAGRPAAAVRLCGDARCLEALAAVARARGWRVLPGWDEIPAAALAERAWRRAREGAAWRGAAAIHSAAPAYLRLSDPELRRRRTSEGS